MRSLLHKSLNPQVIVSRLNYGMAAFYALLGVFGLVFVVGSAGTARSAAAVTYIWLVIALVCAHMTLGRYARRGAAWARYGSLAGGLLLTATGYFGVVAGPILGLSIACFCIKPWASTGARL